MFFFTFFCLCLCYPFDEIIILYFWKNCVVSCNSGLKIATDTVANATNIFSLVTKNSGLVATLVIRFLYELDLN